LILIAIGANLPNPVYGLPLASCKAVLPELDKAGMAVSKVSRWYESAPVPASSQPWYINGVAAVATSMNAHQVLASLLAIEAEFGRVRGQRNAARTLDLDLIAFNDLIIEEETGDQSLILPHPRMHQRAFVLCPVFDVAPDWRHPQSGVSVQQMIDDLDNSHSASPLNE